MTPREMEALIGAHLRAEGNGDPVGAVANHTEDIDVVGFPGSPAIIESLMTATVAGQFLGIAGNGMQLRFCNRHVFEFRDGRISRENLWLDGAGPAAQLTS